MTSCSTPSREKALVDRDVGAGALWLNIQERREMLLGISAPAP